MLRLPRSVISSFASLIITLVYFAGAASAAIASDTVTPAAVVKAEVTKQSAQGALQNPFAWRWSSAFAPHFGCDGTVMAIEALGGGRLVIGGQFSVCDGVGAASIAIFDPGDGSFSPIVVNGINGVSGTVWSIKRAGSSFYVGGMFSFAGDTLVNDIAVFDGEQWQGLPGGGSIGLVGDEVRSLLFDNGMLYAGGRFTTGAGAPLNRVGRWDGASWDDMAGGVTGPGLVSVDDLLLDATTPGALYALGNFDEAGETTVNNVSHWDGSQWSALVDSDELVGLETIPEAAIVWNGADPPNSVVNAFAIFDNQLIAGGGFSQAGGQSAQGLARFDGTHGQPLGDGVDGSVEAVASFQGDLIVAGNFSTAGGVPADGLECIG